MGHAIYRLRTGVIYSSYERVTESWDKKNVHVLVGEGVSEKIVTLWGGGPSIKFVSVVEKLLPVYRRTMKKLH